MKYSLSNIALILTIAANIFYSVWWASNIDSKVKTFTEWMRNQKDTLTQIYVIKEKVECIEERLEKINIDLY